LHKFELDSITDEEKRLKRFVEINVLEQTINLYKTWAVQQRRAYTRQRIDEFGFVQPRIHPCVYEPGTGELKKLDVEMGMYLNELAPIYDLTVEEKPEEEEEMPAWVGGMGPSTVTPLQ